jgi:DNA-binding IscR family transcriptional regulator
MEPSDGILEEIVTLLSRRGTSYARPATSVEIGRELNVSPSYVRECSSRLRAEHLVGVRRGPGGGYYVVGEAATDGLRRGQRR